MATHNQDSGRGQPGVLGVNVPDLHPDHHRATPRGGRVSGDLELPFTEKSPPRDRRAELAVYGQIQHIAVAAAAVLVLDDVPGLGEEP